MRIYLSGPMRNIKEYNKQGFYSAEKELKKMGYAVTNPHRLSRHVFKKFNGAMPEPSDFMRLDIQHLCKCDAVYMLDGWKRSWGAKWERIIAKCILNLPIYYSFDELRR